MNRKKIIIIIFGVIFLIIVTLSLVFVFWKRPYKKYLKYMASIIVSSESIKPMAVTIYDDGSIARADSSTINKNAFIIGNDLYYLEGNTFYKLKVDKTYRDIYDILLTYKKGKRIAKTDNVSTYNTNLNSKEINKLLEALMFRKKTVDSGEATVNVVDKKIESFNLKIDNIDDYRNVEIKIKFSSLDNQFTINNEVFKSENEMIPSNRKKIVDAEENVFEIIK